MNKEQLTRVHKYLSDSIEAWGPDNPMSAKAGAWADDVEEEIRSMPDEYLDTEWYFIASDSVPVGMDEVKLGFENDLMADAFKAWWKTLGAEVFAEWCQDNNALREHVFVRGN